MKLTIKAALMVLACVASVPAMAQSGNSGNTSGNSGSSGNNVDNLAMNIVFHNAVSAAGSLYSSIMRELMQGRRDANPSMYAEMIAVIDNAIATIEKTGGSSAGVMAIDLMSVKISLINALPRPTTKSG